MFGVFFQGVLAGFQSPVPEFDKNCTQNAYFHQKVDFCIFGPKNLEVIENSSKTPLNFSPLQCTYLGKNSFQYHKGLVRKKIIEKWLLRTSVQCICIWSKLVEIDIITIEPRHEISNNVFCATSKASDQPAYMRSLIRAFAEVHQQ